MYVHEIGDLNKKLAYLGLDVFNFYNEMEGIEVEIHEIEEIQYADFFKLKIYYDIVDA